MKPGVIDLFAYQEALLVMTIFGIAVLTMIWVGFRRWLQHKENMGRLIAEQTADRVERVEDRLSAVEQIVTDGGTPAVMQVDAPHTKPPHDSTLKREEDQAKR